MKVTSKDKNKQAFFSQLEIMFAGSELQKFKGESGFSNLLGIKSCYFQTVKIQLDAKIKERFKLQQHQEDFYDKAKTFFDSYLNETGCPYFNKTEFYKNLYEKVYTNSEDTSLFYKTSKLYYVKSDSIPSNATYEIKDDDSEEIRTTVIFDCKKLRYTSTNEKKELKFLLSDLSKRDKTITLLVLYKDQKIDLGDDYSFELGSKREEDRYVLTSTNKENLSKFDELIQSYDLQIKPSEVAEAINIYKKQKEVDFFIHKDAEGFLKEQFNLYLYNYLFNDNELKFNDWNIARLEQIKILKETIFEIIELIARFEDELKAMWLKPKFVKKLDYIVTLDKIDPKFHDEIKAITELQNEWSELGFDTTSSYLPVDTKYLEVELKNRLLASLNNLDELTDGVLIKSDNFQALNTILPKYKEQIDLIYIDPPFNTGSDFAYKDRFQDSTWLTLMENRLAIAREFLSKQGSFYLHLDYRANYLGRLISDSIFRNNLLNEVIYGYRIQGIKRNAYANKHDTIFIYTKNSPDENKHIFNIEKEIQVYQKPFMDVVTVEADLNKLSDKDLKIVQSCIDQKKPLPDKFKDLLFNQYYAETFVRDVWDHDKTKPLISGSSEYVQFQTQKSEGLANRIISNSSNISSLVMDFFNGSGTTINTAHKLGRKWIGVEMGEHFYSVNLPRIKKTLYGVIGGISKELEKDGLLKTGGIVKYYELESYEDVLAKAHYAINDDGIINLYQSEKLATVSAIIEDDNGIRLDPNGIDPTIDIFETISNLTGMKIKHRNNEKCTFIDNGKEVVIEKEKLYFGDYPYLRKLVWWK